MKMAIFDGVSGKATVTSGGGSVAAGDVPGSADKFITINGRQVDPSFLDALYAGGKVSASAREAILNGSDPTLYGLNEYDLFYLTARQLGSKSTAASTFGLIPAYSPTTVYPSGSIVSYQPPGTQYPGYYQSTVGNAPAGTLPTNLNFWQVIASPGPVVLIETDLLNPALAAVAAAGAGIAGIQNTSGTAVATITVPAGKRYKVTVSEARPNTAGTSMATDCNVDVVPLIAETLNADGTVSLVVTPRWTQLSTANNSAIAAVAASFLSARLRVEQLG
jgi:hypothetical protein